MRVIRWRWLKWIVAGLAAASAAAAADDGLRAQARALTGLLEPAAGVDAPQVRLGQALFFDTRLGADGVTGCVSCHLPEEWGADGRALSPDARGKLTERNSQTVFNAATLPALRWRGDRRSAAHQAEDSIKGSMGYAQPADIVPVLERLGYADRFAAAFPDAAAPASPANFALALEVYQRTLVTPAPFDAFLDGDDAALTPAQQAGLRRFIDTGCAGCHNGVLLGGTQLQKFGLVRDYWLATGSIARDVGRYAVTGDEADRDVFRVPILRNIARTAPYFHDGSVATLADAIRVMADVQLGRQLDDPAVAEIEAFLESLTGEVPANFTP